MYINIECQCGKSIEYDETESLYNEDWTPHEIVCPCCRAVFELNIHMSFIKDGDPSKKFPRDDPGYGEDYKEDDEGESQ
jgi:hypothetical protein